MWYGKRKETESYKGPVHMMTLEQKEEEFSCVCMVHLHGNARANGVEVPLWKYCDALEATKSVNFVDFRDDGPAWPWLSFGLKAHLKAREISRIGLSGGGGGGGEYYTVWRITVDGPGGGG